MQYLAAYALASQTNASPSKDDVTKIMKAAGIEVDAADLEFVFTAIGEKSVNELIAEGAYPSPLAESSH